MDGLNFDSAYGQLVYDIGSLFEKHSYLLESERIVENEKEIFRQIKLWYDGYHFGKTDVYCPWDVMNYIRDIQQKPDAKPTGYWKNTSDNSIIRSFIDFAGIFAWSFLLKFTKNPRLFDALML